MNTLCHEAGITAHVSLGIYGRLPFEHAVAEALSHPPSDPLLGVLSTRKLQLCPQNRGCLDTETARQLQQDHPDIEWRLHADIRINNNHRIIDLCDWPAEQAYFRQLAELSHLLRAPVYSAHAGKRSHASLKEVIWFSQEMTQVFGHPVAIEGHYPTRGAIWLLDSWEEYRAMFESGVYFALDLSHLHILASRSRRVETGLILDMLASDKCVEVHVSHNDGQRDQHLPLTGVPWWLPVLAQSGTQASIFSEGRVLA